MSHDPSDTLDVVVIGAGQAGLALGYHLIRKRSRFVIVDGADTIGQSWRGRWDSLRLFSSAQYDGLPGMRFPAAPDSYPTKDQVADYLTAYADRFHLPVLLGHQVTGVTREPGTRFTVHTSQGPLRTRQVVVATGAFQRPHVPEVAGRFSGDVTQVHSAHYRNPGQLPDGPVLVVGAGNSGLQIAEELAASRPVHLAVGSKLAQVPQRILGRDLFWWLTRTGAINKPSTSLLARRMRARGDLVIGTSVDRVAGLGVTVHPRLVDATESGAVFSDGSSLAPSAIVWATGFRPDYPWLGVPGALDDTGRPVHTRGVSPVEGLYFLGLPWQHTRGSALLGFVRHDAAWIADQIQEAAPAAVVQSPAVTW